MNKKQNRYIPDYLVTPGEVIQDYLDHLGMPQSELATRTGLARKTVNEIVKGKSPITPETALKLERTLGRPAHFWNNMERQFQEDRVRLNNRRALASHLNWVDKFPVGEMVKRGWIRKGKDKSERLEEVLRFFGVVSPNQWDLIWSKKQVAYRRAQSVEACADSVFAWLRQGEIEAQKIVCKPFNEQQFKKILREIRGLTVKSPEVFVPRMEELCASVGVAVVFVPEFPRTDVYGATTWLEDKAVIQLSLLGKNNGQLWFTFFHEAAHILMHGRKYTFVETKAWDEGTEEKKEKKADNFARDHLIPLARHRSFLASWDGQSLDAISAFAREIDIDPGVVVGRLQFDKDLHEPHGNELKQQYSWG